MAKTLTNKMANSVLQEWTGIEDINEYLWSSASNLFFTPHPIGLMQPILHPLFYTRVVLQKVESRKRLLSLAVELGRTMYIFKALMKLGAMSSIV